MDLLLLLALLNSKLADWYFRLGSTNAHVSHYQLYNLPCPSFTETGESDGLLLTKASAAIDSGKTPVARKLLEQLLIVPPFNPSVREVILDAVKRITAIEAARGEIARTARSALHPSAQPYQDLIDWLLFKMAGLSDAEIAGLEARYTRML
jgi:hypothetical protein